MQEVYKPLQNKRLSFRYYKSNNKALNHINIVTSTSAPKHLNQISNLRYSHSPTKIINKQIPSTLKSEFNLCSSKNVFVFARKSSNVYASNFIRTKKNHFRREMTQEVFSLNHNSQQKFQRSMVRSSSNSRRQKTSSETQRKRPISQQLRKTTHLNPEPWEMKGQAHDFESLF